MDNNFIVTLLSGFSINSIGSNPDLVPVPVAVLSAPNPSSQDNIPVSKIVGFKLPNGDIVRFSVALEVEDINTGNIRYVNSKSEMSSLGFEAQEPTLRTIMSPLDGIGSLVRAVVEPFMN